MLSKDEDVEYTSGVKLMMEFWPGITCKAFLLTDIKSFWSLIATKNEPSRGSNTSKIQLVEKTKNYFD